MLTVLIETKDSERELADSLVPLVGAVVGGLLKRVIVWDRGSSDGTEIVAAGAGCDLVKDAALGEVLAQVKTPWVLVLKPGSRLELGWEDAVQQHMDSNNSAASFRLPSGSAGKIISSIFGQKPTLDAGLLAPISMLSNIKVLADAPKQLKPVLLKHGIIPARAYNGE